MSLPLKKANFLPALYSTYLAFVGDLFKIHELLRTVAVLKGNKDRAFEALVAGLLVDKVTHADVLHFIELVKERDELVIVRLFLVQPFTVDRMFGELLLVLVIDFR